MHYLAAGCASRETAKDAKLKSPSFPLFVQRGMKGGFLNPKSKIENLKSKMAYS
jgi:hypothetical protein